MLQLAAASSTAATSVDVVFERGDRRQEHHEHAAAQLDAQRGADHGLRRRSAARRERRGGARCSVRACVAERVAPSNGSRGDTGSSSFGSHGSGSESSGRRKPSGESPGDQEEVLAAQRPRRALPVRRGRGLRPGRGLQRQDVADRRAMPADELLAQPVARSPALESAASGSTLPRQVGLVAQDPATHLHKRG